MNGNYLAGALTRRAAITCSSTVAMFGIGAWWITIATVTMRISVVSGGAPVAVDSGVALFALALPGLQVALFLYAA